MNVAIIILLVAAQLAYWTLPAMSEFTIDNNDIKSVLVFFESIGFGHYVLLLPGLGAVKAGIFTRPCHRVVILILSSWILVVGVGWVWMANMSDISSDLTEGEHEIAQMVIDERASYYNDDPIPSLDWNKTRIVGVHPQENNLYCIRSQVHTWMRIPVRVNISCYRDGQGLLHRPCICGID